MWRLAAVLCLCVCGSFAAESAWNTPLAVDYKQLPLPEALKLFQEKTGLALAVPGDLAAGEPVALQAAAMPAEEVLYRVLNPRGLVCIQTGPNAGNIVPTASDLGLLKGIGRAFRIFARLELKLEHAQLQGAEVRVPDWTDDDDQALLRGVVDTACWVTHFWRSFDSRGGNDALIAQAAVAYDADARAGVMMPILSSASPFPKPQKRRLAGLLASVQKLADDPDPIVRACHVFALGAVSERAQMPGNTVSAAFKKALTDQALEVRFALALALLSSQNPEPATLNALCNDARAAVRVAAKCNRLQDPPGIILQDDNPLARSLILAALVIKQNFPVEDYAARLKEWGGDTNPWLKFNAELLSGTKETGGALAAAISSGKPSHQAAACAAVFLRIMSGRRGPDDETRAVAAQVVPLTGAPSALLRAVALLESGFSASPEALAPIIAAMRSPDQLTRLAGLSAAHFFAQAPRYREPAAVPPAGMDEAALAALHSDVYPEYTQAAGVLALVLNSERLQALIKAELAQVPAHPRVSALLEQLWQNKALREDAPALTALWNDIVKTGRVDLQAAFARMTSGAVKEALALRMVQEAHPSVLPAIVRGTMYSGDSGYAVVQAAQQRFLELRASASPALRRDILNALQEMQAFGFAWEARGAEREEPDKFIAPVVELSLAGGEPGDAEISVSLLTGFLQRRDGQFQRRPLPAALDALSLKLLPLAAHCEGLPELLAALETLRVNGGLSAPLGAAVRDGAAQLAKSGSPQQQAELLIAERSPESDLALAGLLQDGKVPAPLREQAIQALAGRITELPAKYQAYLLQRVQDAAEMPGVRRAAFGALVNQESCMDALVTALETGDDAWTTQALQQFGMRSGWGRGSELMAPWKTRLAAVAEKLYHDTKRSESLRTSALHVYATFAPQQAAPEIERLLLDKNAGQSFQAAASGCLARANPMSKIFEGLLPEYASLSVSHRGNLAQAAAQTRDAPKASEFVALAMRDTKLGNVRLNLFYSSMQTHNPACAAAANEVICDNKADENLRCAAAQWLGRQPDDATNVFAQLLPDYGQMPVALRAALGAAALRQIKAPQAVAFAAMALKDPRITDRGSMLQYGNNNLPPELAALVADNVFNEKLDANARAAAADGILRSNPESDLFERVIPVYAKLPAQLRQRLGELSARYHQAPKALDYLLMALQDGELSNRVNFLNYLPVPFPPGDQRAATLATVLDQIVANEKETLSARIAAAERLQQQQHLSAERLAWLNNIVFSANVAATDSGRAADTLLRGGGGTDLFEKGLSGYATLSLATRKSLAALAGQHTAAPKATEFVLRALQDKELGEGRAEFLNGLYGELETPLAAALVALVVDENEGPKVRAAAAACLGRHPDTAVTLLDRLLPHYAQLSRELKEALVLAAARAPDQDKYVDLVISALHDPALKRENILTNFQSQLSPKLAPAVCEAVFDENIASYGRISGIDALARMPQPSVFEKALPVYAAQNPDIRAALGSRAAQYPAASKAAEVTLLALKDKDLGERRCEILDALASRHTTDGSNKPVLPGPGISAVVKQVLQDEKEHMRARLAAGVCLLVWKAMPPESADWFSATILDTKVEAQVRVRALEALGRAGAETKIFAQALPVYGSQPVDIRLALAFAAAGALKAPQAKALLSLALKDKGLGNRRENVLFALNGKVDGELVAVITELLLDGQIDAKLRAAAARSLGWQSDQNSGVYEKLLPEYNRLPAEVRFALATQAGRARQAPKAAEFLCAALRDPSLTERKQLFDQLWPPLDPGVAAAANDLLRNEKEDLLLRLSAAACLSAGTALTPEWAAWFEKTLWDPKLDANSRGALIQRMGMTGRIRPETTLFAQALPVFAAQPVQVRNALANAAARAPAAPNALDLLTLALKDKTLSRANIFQMVNRPAPPEIAALAAPLALDESEPADVRAAAIRCAVTGNADSKVLETLAPKYTALPKELREALASAAGGALKSPQAKALLLQALKDNSLGERRQNVLYSLMGKMDDETAAVAVELLLDDKNDLPIRLAAAQSLGTYNDNDQHSTVFAQVLPKFSGLPVELRSAVAARAVQSRKQPKAVDLLCAALRDSAVPDRAQLFGNLWPPAEPEITAVAYDLLRSEKETLSLRAAAAGCLAVELELAPEWAAWLGKALWNPDIDINTRVGIIDKMTMRGRVPNDTLLFEQGLANFAAQPMQMRLALANAAARAPGAPQALELLTLALKDKTLSRGNVLQMIRPPFPPQIAALAAEMALDEGETAVARAAAVRCAATGNPDSKLFESLAPKYKTLPQEVRGALALAAARTSAAPKAAELVLAALRDPELTNNSLRGLLSALKPPVTPEVLAAVEALRNDERAKGFVEPALGRLKVLAPPRGEDF